MLNCTGMSRTTSTVRIVAFANANLQGSSRKNAASSSIPLEVSDPLFGIVRRLEQSALRDPYFIERKPYPNVDFYSFCEPSGRWWRCSQ